MISVELKFLANCKTSKEVAEKVYEFLGIEFDPENYARLSFAFDGLHNLGQWCNFQVRYVWFRVIVSISEGYTWCYQLSYFDFNVHELASSEP